MLKQTLAILVLTACSATVFAQRPVKKELKIYKPAYDSLNKAYLIPDSIFSMQVDVLHMPHVHDTAGYREKYGYEIRWLSECIDGDLILTITKRQIYLRSGHNNPNPNRLYWVVNITDEQYKIIQLKINSGKRRLRPYLSEGEWYTPLSYHKFRKEKGIPEKWTEKEEDEYHKDCDDKRYKNTSDLIAFLNEALPAHAKIPFLTKSAFEKNEAIRIASVEGEFEYEREIS